MKTQRHNLKYFQFGELLFRVKDRPTIITTKGIRLINYTELDPYFTDLKTNCRYMFKLNDLPYPTLRNIWFDKYLRPYLSDGTFLRFPAPAWTIYPFEDPDSEEFGREPFPYEIINYHENYIFLQKIRSLVLPQRLPIKLMFGNYIFDYFGEHPKTKYIGHKKVLHFSNELGRATDIYTGLKWYVGLIDLEGKFENSELWFDDELNLYIDNGRINFTSIDEEFSLDLFDIYSTYDNRYNTIDDLNFLCTHQRFPSRIFPEDFIL